MLAELKALLKSPKLWITIIGVSLIPALYNLIFLSSMWNPYGNVKHLPVAVVNKDKSASFQNKILNIGHDMVDNMSKNKNLDYHFVTENEAQKGIEDGDYYMVITFPENLSSNAASLLTNDPKKLEISYQTTAGHSFVSSKMSDSAMSKLKDNCSKILHQLMLELSLGVCLNFRVVWELQRMGLGNYMQVQAHFSQGVRPYQMA